jgi:deoxyribodipyrimidine photo-lyase
MFNTATPVALKLRPAATAWQVKTRSFVYGAGAMIAAVHPGTRLNKKRANKNRIHPMEKKKNNSHQRTRILAKGRQGKGPVVYWMSRDQRVFDNWALLWAQEEAILHQKPLLVVFVLDFNKNSSLRRYSFMVRPLQELQQNLIQLDIGFHLISENPAKEFTAFLVGLDVHCIVSDFEPIKERQQLKNSITQEIKAPFYEVDTHNIIPAWVCSDKKEYAAYTIRPKINRLIDDYLTEIPKLKKHPHPYNEPASPIDSKSLLPKVAHPSITELKNIAPGEKQGIAAAKRFIKDRLKDYPALRNDPCQDGQSGLSPYLHFGHLSPQRLALLIKQSQSSQDSIDDFLEELIVRRELADNYCLYEPAYDSFSAFPQWAQKTLDEHRRDKRDATYSLHQLETGQTHQSLWNACQRDLVEHGKLHGYLRMYWAKKILEWTEEPEQAMEYAIYLNDTYSIDGLDPNGYAGVAWSIGGVHDRAWRERSVFGKVRYMNEAGCRRKFNVDHYIDSVLSS